jgi:hypothetical protein
MLVIIKLGATMLRPLVAGLAIAALVAGSGAVASADPTIVGHGRGGVAMSPLPFLDDCPAGTYQAASGDCVERPDSSPSNATAICRDGTDSHSEHRSGTCSGHGGVSQWCPCGSASASSAGLMPQASSEDTFMALAANPNTGDVTWVTHATSQQLANQIALNDCVSKYGDGCGVLAGMRNGCAALAIDWASGIWQGGIGPDPDTAGADALGKLPTSQIKAARCSWN